MAKNHRSNDCMARSIDMEVFDPIVIMAGNDNSIITSQYDDETLSQQVDDILESQDRFIFSSGRKLLLSCTKSNGSWREKNSEKTMLQPSPRVVDLHFRVDDELFEFKRSDSLCFQNQSIEENSSTSSFLREKVTLSDPDEPPLFDRVPILNNENLTEKGKILKDVSNCPQASLLQQEAWAERERARKWARQVRMSVIKWVEDYRALMDLKASQQNQGTQVSAETMQRYQRAVQFSQETICNLEQKLRQCHKHYHAVEEELHELILFLKNRLWKFEQHKGHHHEFAELSSKRKKVLQEEVCFENQISAKSSSIVEIDSRKEQQSLGIDMENMNANHTYPQCGTAGSSNTIVNLQIETPKISPSPSVITSSSTNSNSGEKFCITAPSSEKINSRSRVRSQRRTFDGNSIELKRYGNGSQKEIHPDGLQVIRFQNGDVQTIGQDGSIAYYYANQATIEVKYPDGTIEYEYPNGQKEQHFQDGAKIVLFPDGTTKKIASNTSHGPSSRSVQHGP